METHVSEYLRQVPQGETVLVFDQGAPLIEIRAVGAAPKGRKRVFGRYDNTVKIDDSVFAPMTDEEVNEWMDNPHDPLNAK